MLPKLSSSFFLNNFFIYTRFRHRRFYKLTYRQREYLEYIHTKNRLLYKEIIDELKERYPKQMDVNGNVPNLPLERHSLMEKDEKDYNSHM